MLVIDRSMLQQMYNIALAEYKDRAKDHHESDNQFLAKCWCEAFISVSKGEGYEITSIVSGTMFPDGVKRISFAKPGV